MAKQVKEDFMSQWKMNSADFKRLLEDVQDYRCAITGLPLLPENVEIAFKTPLSRGGSVALTNVHLVHNSVIKLAREHTIQEIRAIAKAIVQYGGETCEIQQDRMAAG
jgi:vacuolar-type H+-ATPase subunit C/Vma6